MLFEISRRYFVSLQVRSGSLASWYAAFATTSRRPPSPPSSMMHQDEMRLTGIPSKLEFPCLGSPRNRNLCCSPRARDVTLI